MRFFFTMFYNCTKFQNNPRGCVEKHPKICWIDMEWPYSSSGVSMWHVYKVGRASLYVHLRQPKTLYLNPSLTLALQSDPKPNPKPYPNHNHIA